MEAPDCMNGQISKRWLNDSISSHELYNLGHLYEAAAAHYQATGKRSLLEIALKSADLVNRDFGWDRTKSLSRASGD